MPMKNGFRYCLTIVDSFTRFLRIYPLRKNRAIDTAQNLVKFVNEFGKIPKVISTDRGSHFIGEVLNELCKFLNIKQNLHCAWRPQSSGILERQHRTFKDSISIVEKELGQPWPFLVDQVVQAINAAENRATRVSPFYAMYGRHYSLDIPIVESRDHSIENPLSHGMNLGTKLAKIHKLVQFSAESADIKLDEKSSPSKPELLESGDEVLSYIETCSYFMGSSIDIAFGGSHSYESLDKNLKKISLFLEIS